MSDDVAQTMHFQLLDIVLDEAQTRDIEMDRETAAFAVDFARLMVDVAMADREFHQAERAAMIDALEAWTDLDQFGIDLVLDMVIEYAGLSGRTPLDEGARMASSFAARHGPGAALLMLDCVFGVATAEGRLSHEELQVLYRMAAALNVDPALFKRFLRRWTPNQASGDMVVQLDRQRLAIGRDPECEVHLDDPDVAGRHAALQFAGGEWWIESMSSKHGTFVEGRRIEREKLGPGDRVRIGRFWLRVVPELGQLHVFNLTKASALTVRDLKVTVPVAGRRRTILDGLSFSVFSGELVALVGPSGSGKTTLLNAISGIRPPEDGDVLLDGEPFHPLLEQSRNLVGEVPQEDIVHPSLTVQEALWYSARLRLSPDLRDDEVQAQVDRVLTELDIRNIGDSRIGDATRRGISGGQRKRVNLGQELLSQSTHILFLDEPTSGLDPHGSREIVKLVRRLADGGRIIFLVTHDLSPQVVEMLDQVIVLTTGGRMAFFGPPDEACQHFGVERLDEVITAFQGKDVDAVAAEYRESQAYRRYVGTREKVLGIGGASHHGTTGVSGGSSGGLFRQLGFLARRYTRVKLRDRGGMAILLLQAPILAVIMAIVFPQADPSALFIVSLATLWFGCSASVREVIAEQPILRRERRVGLNLLPYLGSKFGVLLALNALQCALLVGLLYPLMGLHGYGFSMPLLYVVALLTGAVGLALGLLISSAMRSSEAAVGTLPLVLIPQIVFGGLIVYVKEMPTVARYLSHLTVTRWSFNALLRCGEELFKPGGTGFERAQVPMGGILYLLGFKQTSDVLDNGLSVGALLGILAGMMVVLLLGALLVLWRRARRNAL